MCPPAGVVGKQPPPRAADTAYRCSKPLCVLHVLRMMIACAQGTVCLGHRFMQRTVTSWCNAVREEVYPPNSKPVAQRAGIVAQGMP